MRAPVMIEGSGPDTNGENSKVCNMGSVSGSESGKNGEHYGPQGSVVPAEDNQIIKIQLTPDQCMAVRSRGCLDKLLGANLGRGDLDVEKYEDGRIAFNLHLRLVTGASMLNSMEVCRMLQVSRSFLAKNVRNGSIKSYKIGRLRRFLLDDILGYMSQARGFEKALVKVAHNTNIVRSKERAGLQSDQ